MTALLLNGLLTVYFVICTQLLYPLTLAVFSWISVQDPVLIGFPTFKSYSQSYCALFLFASLAIICSKKDLSIFMKVGSVGVIFVFMLILFIIYTSVVAFTNTDLSLGTADDALNTDWTSEQRTLILFNSNFSPLAGIFGVGYYLHTCSIPIVRSAAKPEKNDRNLFLGFFLVFVSYILLGGLGYVGFIGNDFTEYYLTKVGTSTDAQVD